MLEIDAGYVGGVQRGKKKQAGRDVHKSVVAVAAERRGPGPQGQRPALGFTVSSVVEDASATSLLGFLQSRAEVGSVILTDRGSVGM